MTTLYGFNEMFSRNSCVQESDGLWLVESQSDFYKDCFFYQSWFENIKEQWVFIEIPVDTGRKLNVHKTFRRCSGHFLNVLCTFNLRPVSTGIAKTLNQHGL